MCTKFISAAKIIRFYLKSSQLTETASKTFSLRIQHKLFNFPWTVFVFIMIKYLGMFVSIFIHSWNDFFIVLFVSSQEFCLNNLFYLTFFIFQNATIVSRYELLLCKFDIFLKIHCQTLNSWCSFFLLLMLLLLRKVIYVHRLKEQ